MALMNKFATHPEPTSKPTDLEKQGAPSSPKSRKRPVAQRSLFFKLGMAAGSASVGCSGGFHHVRCESVQRDSHARCSFTSLCCAECRPARRTHYCSTVQDPATGSSDHGLPEAPRCLGGRGRLCVLCGCRGCGGRRFDPKDHCRCSHSPTRPTSDRSG